MKTLIVLFVMMTGFIFSQENPWLPKGTNPWIQYETSSIENNEREIQDTLQDINSNDLSENVDTIMTLLPQTKVEPIDVTEKHKSDSELCANIQSEADSLYYHKGDFVAGFVIGLVFGIYGLAGDGIYSATWNKKEKQILETFQTDSTYQTLTHKQIKKHVKKSTGDKKFRKAAKGTIVAVAIRIGILMITLKSVL